MGAPTEMQKQAALDHFIRQPVSAEMVQHLVLKSNAVIRCEEVTAVADSLPPTPPHSPPREIYAGSEASTSPALPTLDAFICSLVEKSHVQVSTLMSSLVYLSRLRARLPPVAKGMRCTVHRIFLASLILAAKNLNDSSPKNKHWARYTCVTGFPQFGFSTTEVNLMEKQLLFLLDWDLRITNTDLYTHFEPFLAPIRLGQAQQAAEADDRARRLRTREREIIKQQYRELSQLQDLQRRHQQAIATYESTYRRSHLLDRKPAPSAGVVTRHTAPSIEIVPTPSRLHQRAISNTSFTTTTSSAPSHSRVPSLSPPSFTDIPRLARSGTVESLASSSSGASSSRSTPASSVSPTIEVLASAEYVYLASHNTGRRSISASPTEKPRPYSLAQSVRGVQKAYHQLTLDDDADKKIKKIKTSGSLFSRFLTGAGGVATRPQTAVVDLVRGRVARV